MNKQLLSKKLQQVSLAAMLGLLVTGYSQSFAQNGYFKMPKNIKNSDYISNTVVMKVKSEYASVFNTANFKHAGFQKILAGLGQNTIVQKFPHSKPNVAAKNVIPGKQVDLTRIYELNYLANVSLEKVINQMIGTGLFDYVEPHYVQHISFVPNDPFANDSSTSGQYHLAKIRATLAWSICQGDTNTVVGITDTGTDTGHPDLKDNVKHNYNDPINGIDDDNDGYVDNFSGWDVGMNDNNPQWQANSHGVHVSGLAAASTNNGIGVAGTGFKCKFLPVKIADAGGSLVASYEGITYAADHGCSVINCSWGGPGYSQMGQDVVNYATFTKNALVVVAAGNDGGEVISYPAAYDNVLCVASTGYSDNRSSFTSYGFHVDVSAPGSNDLSTLPASQGSYGQESGTSMASPVTAGAAALLRAWYPNYSAVQIAALLKATTDNIYQFTQNKPLLGKLGTGRINLYKALTDTNKVFTEMVKYNVADNNDQAFMSGDTLSLTGYFYNYLNASKGTQVTFSTASNSVTVLSPSTFILGDLASGDSADNKNTPAKIYVKPGVNPNTSVPIDIVTTDSSGFINKQRIGIIVNVDYINYHENDIAVTITSNSRIGYKGDTQTGGIGFSYKGSPTMIYDGGLMVGIDGSHVSDNLRNDTQAQDADFASVSSVGNVKRKIPSVFSPSDLESVFSDAPTPSRIPVKVRQRTYAFNTTGNTKYVIVQYCIHNTGIKDLNGLYAGICADWDIDTPQINRIGEDTLRRMGYSYSLAANGLYAGIKLLSKIGPWNHYAIDNDSSGSGGINMADGYTGGEKYASLSTRRSTAGMAVNGADVIDVVSTGPFNGVGPGDSVVVAFALIGGENVADIQVSADSAQAHYTDIPLDLHPLGIKELQTITGSSLKPVYPNPVNDVMQIQFNIAENAATSIDLYDIQGRKVAPVWSSNTPNIGTYQLNYNTAFLPAGIYELRLQNVNSTPKVQKVVIVK